MIIVNHKEIFQTMQYKLKSKNCGICVTVCRWFQTVCLGPTIRDIIKYRTNLFGHNKRWDQLIRDNRNITIFNQPKLVPSSRFHCIFEILLKCLLWSEFVVRVCYSPRIDNYLHITTRRSDVGRSDVGRSGVGRSGVGRSNVGHTFALSIIVLKLIR